jgi:hypothetical protein
LGGGLEIISARGSDRGALLSGGEQDVYDDVPYSAICAFQTHRCLEWPMIAGAANLTYQRFLMLCNGREGH